MRKSLVISCLLCVLTVLGLSGIVFYVSAQDEQVILTESVLMGDKAYAEDISFQINSHWNEQLLWETSVDIGEETVTDTQFSFYPNGFEYENFFEAVVELEYSTNFGYSSSSNLLEEDHYADIPFKDVFIDVASRTEPGESRTETVKLADYYEYFDLQLHFNSGKYLRRYSYGPYDGEEWSYLNEVLAMRIPEGLLYEATVEKEEDGSVHDIDGNDVNNDVRIFSNGIVLKDGIYICVYAADEEGVVSGISETGYGIYKLPITWGALDKEESAFIMMKEFAFVYPLEEKILALEADAAEKELFLVFERAGEIFLHRIDKESMTLLQEFPLGIAEKYSVCQDIQVTEEGIMLLMNGNQIYFAEKRIGEAGINYEVTVDFSMEKVEEFAPGTWGIYDFDYEGGRLAFVWGDGQDRYYQCGNSVYLFVLEGNEIKLLMYYENSLDHADMYWDYGNKLHPSEPYEISIGK